MFDHIILEPEQKELFCVMVDAARSVPRQEREKFMAVKTNQGVYLLHRGLRNVDVRPFEGDLEALADAGLLRTSYGGKGTPSYDITPVGYRYYEHLKMQSEEPVERIEAHTRSFLDTVRFRRDYQHAYNKWAEAERILWAPDAEGRLTEIGHICREAIQRFSDVLVERYGPEEPVATKAQTKNKLRAVVDAQRKDLSKAALVAVEALVDYWNAVSDLVQRQEHGALKEGEPLVWTDARRVVFLTALVMLEIDQLLTLSGKPRRRGS